MTFEASKCDVASERSINFFLAKITIIKVFPCRGEHVRTYILWGVISAKIQAALKTFRRFLN